MGIFTEKISFMWLVQFYAGLKVFHYFASLVIIPREIQLGHPLHVPAPFSEQDLSWRIGLRVLGLLIWMGVFFWAKGRLGPSDGRSSDPL